MNPEPRPPNILFVFSDQQRWDTVGCYKESVLATPHLERLADEGVVFENAFTCQPVSGPARACLQTGKYATEVGCYRNAIALPLGEKTIAHWLGNAGYETAYIGKWHLASSSGPGIAEPVHNEGEPVPPERRGGYRDFWLAADVLEFTSHGFGGTLFNAAMEPVPFEKYRVAALTDFAIEYLSGRDSRRPFFLFLSYIEPHHQNNHKHFEGPTGSKKRFRDFIVPGDLVGAAGDWHDEFPDYLGCCESLDGNFARLRHALEERGEWDNTIVIYTSDHGCHFRTRNAEYKRSCHDASVRIPLIIRGPGFTGGRMVRQLASLIDLPPTILAAAGLAPPPSMRGRPLQALLSTPPSPWLDEVFIQISESQVGRAIRTNRWKYSVRAPDLDGWAASASDTYCEDFLYDLESDPHERENLVEVQALADVRRTLAERLKVRMAQAGEREPQILPARSNE